MLYLWTKGSSDSRSLLESTLLSLCNTPENEVEGRPKALWYASYDVFENKLVDNAPENAHLIHDISADLTMDDAFDQAESLFKTIFPDDVYIEQVPNPEDIKWGEEESAPPS